MLDFSAKAALNGKPAAHQGPRKAINLRKEKKNSSTKKKQLIRDKQKQAINPGLAEIDETVY